MVQWQQEEKQEFKSSEAPASDHDTVRILDLHDRHVRDWYNRGLLAERMEKMDHSELALKSKRDACLSTSSPF